MVTPAAWFTRVARWVARVLRSAMYSGLPVRLWRISAVHLRAELGTAAEAMVGVPATVTVTARAATAKQRRARAYIC
ncbi:hypothetical protein GCM10010435_47060 [Winogradskya consettensis]|uniref:Uncharacterized protein n=1 Tax=Winogradskya consettensis TaxID=113560 RepID=A0A919SHF5_9ACTN|nr:hypothetical protein Aco04nite_31990 [Actinoplanes consettensis]